MKSLEKEISELSMFKGKRKKELNQKLENIKNDIENLKESQFYQKGIKYSEKAEKLNKEKNEYTTLLRECEKEYSLLYTIETIDKNKENILERLQTDFQKEQEEKELEGNPKEKNSDIEI